MSAQHLFPLLPSAGWVSNRLRYPGLHCVSSGTHAFDAIAHRPIQDQDRRASSVMEFDLAAGAETQSLLHLNADGRCQVHWAELI